MLARLMHRSLLATSFAVSLALAAPAVAQCTYTWPASFAGGANDAVLSSAVDRDGNLVVGGRFTSIGGVAANRIARWNGSAWAAIGSGASGDVTTIVRAQNGDLLVGGSFASLDGLIVNGVARLTAGGVQALGSGIDPQIVFGSQVNAIEELPNGDVVVGGGFASASGVPASNIARWNGTSWSALGSGTNGAVRGLEQVGGVLYAVGGFTLAGGVLCNGVARHSGGVWSSLGAGVGLLGATCVAVKSSGEVVVGGPFVTAGGGAANRAAEWNGVSWTAYGAGLNGPVAQLVALPDGSVLAGGSFTTAGGAAAANLARYAGGAWSTFGAGASGPVLHLGFDRIGRLVVGGQFATAGGAAASNLAAVASSCGPQVASFGTGCTGSGGLNTITQTAAARIGSTYRAFGSGMPALAFVADVYGFSSVAVPLALALPQGLPGCTLYASPDVVDVLLPVAGRVDSALPLGYVPSAIGVVFFHQYVPLELDLGFNITAVTASNALQVTIGAF
jgi:hypothetical protein